MKYNGIKIIPLSNVEIVLLELISEETELSGYEIKKLVEARGYHKWADIGTTSIYVGLDKLRKKGLVTAYFDTAKKGKGPIPKRFRINALGTTRLQEAVIDILACSRERDRRFDLGLAGLPLIKVEEAIAALTRRLVLLQAAAQEIEAKYRADGGRRLPFHVRWLFRHPLFLIEHEQTFSRSLIDGLEQTRKEL